MNKKFSRFLIFLSVFPLYAEEHHCPNLTVWDMEYSARPSVSAHTTEIENDNTFLLQGNVSVLSAKNSIKATKANLIRNGDEYSGFLKEGSINNQLFNITFESLNIQDSGDSLSAIDGTLIRQKSLLKLDFENLSRESDIFKLEKVSMSSCSNNPEGWKISGRNVVVNDAGRGTISDMQLELFGKPVLWLPWVPFPATNDRLSGFLEPKIQFGSEGLDLSIPYFLILSASSDITFAPRSLADRGKGFESNFRYKSPLIDIEIDSLFLDKDKKFEGLESLANNRWAGATRAFGGVSGFSYRIDWAKASDFLVLQNIPSFISDIDMNRAPYLLQNASLNYRNNNFELEVRSEDAQLLDPMISKAVAKKPEFEVNYAKSWNALSFSLQALYSKFHLPHPLFQDSELQLDKTNITRRYLKTELNVSHHIDKWLLEADYTSTLREYDSNNVSTPNNSNVESVFMRAGTFLRDPNAHLTFKPFVMFKYTPYEQYGRALLLDDQLKNSFAYDLFSVPLFSGKDLTLDERSLSVGIEFLMNEGLRQFQGMIGIKKNLKQSEVLKEYFDSLQIPNEQVLIDASLVLNNTYIQFAIDYDSKETNISHGQLALQRTFGAGNFKISQHKQHLGTGLYLNEVNFRDISMIANLGNNYQAFVYKSEDVMTGKNMDSYVGVGFENCCLAWRILARDKRLIDLNFMNSDAQLVAEESWKEMISYQNKSRITFEIELKGLMSPSKKIQRLMQNFQE